MANDLIVKDNRLIQAKYHLTKTQIKFISFIASRINKDDTDFFTYKTHLNEILSILDIERSNIKYLDNTLTELMTKIVIIQDDENVIEKSAILGYFKIDLTNEIVEYRFDKAMKPFLLQLKKNFTKLSLRKIMDFKSFYTIRMYEILEQKATLLKKYQNENLITFEISLKELREMLVGEFKKGKIVIKKSYLLYANFRTKVLDVAYKELKSKGDYYFEYDAIKTGRSVSSIKFTIMTNKEKIKKDFKDRKKTFLLSGKERRIAEEQIRRIIQRNKNIKDPLKFEQALFRKYLSGELVYDKDLQPIKDELDRQELTNVLKEYAIIQKNEQKELKLQQHQERVEKFKEFLEKEKKKS